MEKERKENYLWMILNQLAAYETDEFDADDSHVFHVNDLQPKGVTQ